MRGRRISTLLIGHGRVLQKMDDRFARIELGRDIGLGVDGRDADILPAAIGDVGRFGFERIVHQAQRVRLPGVVGVEKGDVVAVGAGERTVARGKRATAVLVDEGDALGVFGSQTLQDFGRAIGRAVVHHDEFHLRVALPEHARDRLAHIGRGVVAGHDDGDQRGVEVVHWSGCLCWHSIVPASPFR